MRAAGSFDYFPVIVLLSRGHSRFRVGVDILDIVVELCDFAEANHDVHSSVNGAKGRSYNPRTFTPVRIQASLPEKLLGVLRRMYVLFVWLRGRVFVDEMALSSIFIPTLLVSPRLFVSPCCASDFPAFPRIHAASPIVYCSN